MDQPVRQQRQRAAEHQAGCNRESPYDSERVGQIEAYDQFGISNGTSVWNASGRYTSINGIVMPTFTQVRAGDLERWRLVHAGVRDSISLQFRNARASVFEDPYQPASLEARTEQVDRQCDGALIPQFSVASDGLTRAQVGSQDQTILQPGYREDLLMTFPAAGIYCVIDASLDASQTVNGQAHGRELLGYVQVLPPLADADNRAQALADLSGRGLTDALRRRVQDWLVASALRFMPADVRGSIVKDLEDQLKLTAFVDHKTIMAAEVTGGQTLGFNIDIQQAPTPNRYEIGTLGYDAATGNYKLQDASP